MSFRLSRLFLFSALLAALPATTAFAQLCYVQKATISPASPRADDSIALDIDGRCGCPIEPEPAFVVLKSSSLIHVVLPLSHGGCFPESKNWSQRVVVGRLPAGTYSVVFVETIANGPPRNAGPILTLTVGEPQLHVKPGFGNAGTEVLLTREGAGSSPASVLFGSVPATSFRVLDANRIVAVAPAQSSNGFVAVEVRQSNGAVAANTHAFEYVQDVDPSRYTHVLFPIAFSGLGAFGSFWASQNLIQNRGSVAIVTDLGTTIAAGETKTLPVFSSNRGLVIGIPDELLADAVFASHARDLSRGVFDAGTEVRVVMEEDAADELRILAVPLDSGYRYNLRLYDVDGTDGRVVTVKTEATGGGLPRETNVTLRIGTVCVTFPCITGEPAFASVDLRDLASITTGPIDITVSSPGARLWALASATNNATQHVTTYTPQR